MHRADDDILQFGDDFKNEKRESETRLVYRARRTTTVPAAVYVYVLCSRGVPLSNN